MSSIGSQIAKQGQRWFTRLHRMVFKASGGRVFGHIGTMEVVVLTTTGRTSGAPRETILSGFEHGEGFVLLASNNGAPSNPQWFRNLVKDPAVQLRRGASEHRMAARVVTGAERDELYAEAVALSPGYGKYQDKTERVIPVVVLDPA